MEPRLKVLAGRLNRSPATLRNPALYFAKGSERLFASGACLPLVPAAGRLSPFWLQENNPAALARNRNHRANAAWWNGLAQYTLIGDTPRA